jgi:mono/diheme cytochrome c family protein
MRRFLRWTGYAAGSLVLLAVIAVAAIWILGGQKLAAHGAGHPEHLAKPTPAQVADAPRQLAVLRCTGCHGKGLRGDLFFDEPYVAKIYAPNLTQIAFKASDEQLARAIRQGIGTDGRSLAIMPSATYARLDDSEVAAVIAAIRALPRGGAVTPPREVGFLGRVGLVTGKFHTTPEEVAQYAVKLPIDLGSQYARGRHMAASNCAECHAADLSGGEMEPGLKAPNLTIAGAYDLAAFKILMRTGVPSGGRKLRVMDEVARDGFSHMTDEEIEQLHGYLQARAQKLSR